MRAGDATVTVVGEERCRNGGRVCLYCGRVAPSQLPERHCSRLPRADDDRHARVDHANRANAGQKVAGDICGFHFDIVAPACSHLPVISELTEEIALRLLLRRH